MYLFMLNEFNANFYSEFIRSHIVRNKGIDIIVQIVDVFAILNFAYKNLDYSSFSLVETTAAYCKYFITLLIH